LSFDFHCDSGRDGEDEVMKPGGYREVFRVAWPLIISTGSFTLMQFVDRMFLAWHSATSIQAALPAGILSFTFISGFMAIAGYANTFVAQYHGAGDPHGCSRATAQGVWLALLSWPLLLALIPVGRALLKTSGHADEVLAEELAYFTILVAGGVMVTLNAAIGSFFTGRGDTFTNMVATIAGNAVNIALDYAMIFGRWGFPEMGIRGAAIATVLAGAVTPGILLALYLGRANRRQFQTARFWRMERPLFWRLVRFGVPSGLHLALDVGSFAVFVLFTGRMGDMALAVSNIAFSVNMVAFMPLVGIGIAASTLVGQYQGRRDSAAAEKVGWTALRIGVFYMTAVALTYIFLPHAYFHLFARKAESGLTIDAMLPLGRKLLLLMATWGVLDAANLILSGALKGAGDTRFVMWYSSLMAWGLLVPGQAVLVMVLDRGILASWMWLTFFIMIVSGGFFLRFRRGRWKSIEVLEHETPVAVRHEDVAVPE
jgi:MATE family multidrug resistance protein